MPGDFEQLLSTRPIDQADDPSQDGRIGANPTVANVISLSRFITPTDQELRRARRLLHAKSAGIFLGVIASYWGLVIAPVPFLVRMLCAAVLAIACIAVATNVMHDANHQAFSRSRRVNRIVSFSLDFLGGSSWLWRYKHNTLHHGSPNVVGIDTDIDQGGVARLAPQQTWRWYHRYQHLYLWPLYGLLGIRWFVFSDFQNLETYGGTDASRRAGGEARRVRQIITMGAGKLVHLTWAIILPLLFHPWWGVALFYVTMSFVVGAFLATVFQMAHCVDEAEFVVAETSHRGADFDLHQLRTTVDIDCRRNVFSRSFAWLLGGLDHQVEHHLLPRVPHTLLPALRTRVIEYCEAHGLRYRIHRGVAASIRSHVRWLKAMGQRPTNVLPPAPHDGSLAA